MWIVALVALPVIILGGLDSLGGAVIAGLVIGVVESLVATYGADIAPGSAVSSPWSRRIW